MTDCDAGYGGGGGEDKECSRARGFGNAETLAEICRGAEQESLAQYGAPHVAEQCLFVATLEFAMH